MQLQLIPLKKCRRCGDQKPLDLFNVERRASDGRMSWCRACCIEYKRERRAANPGAEQEQQRAYREANRQKMRDASARWRRENREAALRGDRAGYAADPAKHIARSRAWQKANADHVRERQRAYAKAHPDVYRDAQAVARARRREAFVAPVRRADIFARDAGVCGLCGLPVDPAAWHLDHVIPLARGGTHEPSNVQVSHPLCNQRKWAN